MIKDYKIYLAVTGGGTEVIGELLRHGGASSYIVGAVVPYAQEFFDRFAGKPDKYSDLASACRLSTTAFNECRKLGFENVLGVGCTASLAKPGYNETRADGSVRKHVAHICLHTAKKTIICSIDFPLSSLVRQTEERLVSAIILRLMQSIDCCDSDLQFYMKDYSEYISRLKQIGCMHEKFPMGINELYTTNESNSVYSYHGITHDNILFAGSFNPCTKNHCDIAKKAYEQFGKKVIFELSIFNYEKPPIDYFSLLKRIESLPLGEEYCAGYTISNIPYFVDKVAYYTFKDYIVGTDTWNRIWDLDEDDFGPYRVFEGYSTHYIVVPRKDEEMNITSYENFTVLDYEDDGWSSTKERECQSN